MRDFFDTSVLVNAYVGELAHHEEASRHFGRVLRGEGELVISSHALAETYSTLTAIPISPRITPSQARSFIENELLPVARVVDLTKEDYRQVVAHGTEKKLVSGVIYDALHACAAERVEADRLLTCNPADFRPLLADRRVEVVAVP